jgi:hypothetical protein
MVINVINIAQTRIFLKMCVLLINKHSKTVVLHKFETIKAIKS